MISFGWHHRFKVHEFEKAQGEGEGGAGHAAVPVVSKSQTQLNSNNKKFISASFYICYKLHLPSFLHPAGPEQFRGQLLSIMIKNSVQLSSVTQSCTTFHDPMNRSTSGLPVHHQLPEFTQTHVHQVGDAIQPSHPLLSPSPPAPNPSHHQSLFQ